MIIQAAVMSKIWHCTYRRKWTDEPYYFHPARVAGVVATIAEATETLITVAYLHDVIEDKCATKEDVTAHFNEEIAEMVQALVNPSKGSKMKRGKRKEADRNYLATLSRDLRSIKLVDRIDNLHDVMHAPVDFRRMYARESILLAEAIGHECGYLKARLVNLAERVKEW